MVGLTSFTRALPSLLPDIWRMIAAPGDFARSYGVPTKKNLARAVAFLGACSALVAAFPNQHAAAGASFKLALTHNLAFGALTCFLLAGCFHLSWKLFGGATSFAASLIVLLYYGSLLLVIFVVFLQIFLGVTAAAGLTLIPPGPFAQIHGGFPGIARTAMTFGEQHPLLAIAGPAGEMLIIAWFNVAVAHGLGALHRLPTWRSASAMLLGASLVVVIGLPLLALSAIGSVYG